MSWDETSGTLCDISHGLDVFGDKWTLLIMREISMGNRRFEDIQIQTGMSSNLLSIRLKRMEQDELIERRRYAAHANRFEYHATQKGKELDGVSLAIRSWGMRWGRANVNAEPAVNLIYKETGETMDALWQPPQTNRPFSFSDCRSSISAAFAEERESKIRAFKAKREKPLAKDDLKRSTRTIKSKPEPKKDKVSVAKPKSGGTVVSRRKMEAASSGVPKKSGVAKKVATVTKSVTAKKAASAQKAAASTKSPKAAKAA